MGQSCEHQDCAPEHQVSRDEFLNWEFLEKEHGGVGTDEIADAMLVIEATQE
jgi:hypothetical protein